MNPRLLLLFLFLVIAHVATSQTFERGYILLKDGQKKEGLIGKMIPGKPDVIQYTANAAAEIQQFRADEVSGYAIGDLVFTSFLTSGDPNDWAFVEILATGELILTEFYQQGLTERIFDTKIFLGSLLTDNNTIDVFQ